MSLHSSGVPRWRAIAVIAGALFATLTACSSTDDVSADDATPNPNGKIAGEACSVGSDCRSGRCEEGRCTASAANASSSPKDGIKNGDETDIDCGGSGAGKCGDGKGCGVANDCTNGVCKGSKCAPAAPDDAVKNGDESDVDCGGKVAPKCAATKGCAANADCESDACSYAKKCVVYKGCTGHFGGDTCGDGETGAAGTNHESCCTTVPITDRPAGSGGSFTIDKYLVTAGRMRAFVERYNGNLQQWAAAAPAGWNDAWTASLPKSMSDALYLLGPGGKRGCNVASQGGRTYAQPPVDGVAAEASDFSKDVLDEKALNCVPWHMAQALCTFDGGHLATAAEIRWVYENRGRAAGATTYPWQWKDTSAYSPTASDMRVIHRYSYATANPPATMRTVNGQYPLDHAFYVAPPGRRPLGANMHGVQDAAGNVMPWVSDGPKMFASTMSWENHDKNLTPATWNQAEGPNGYYAIGARCSR
jgi:formylglycine-generating enzyme required for sulfatase activity